MSQAIQDFLQQFFSNDLVVFILSVLPVSEIRGGLIAARLWDMSPLFSYIICYIGNMLPIPFILLFLRKILAWMKKIPKFGVIVDKLQKKAERKAKSIGKYQYWGLFILVAIPLPGTGAWTGALVADFLDIRMSKALPTIALGVACAGLIMLLGLYALPSIFI